MILIISFTHEYITTDITVYFPPKCHNILKTEKFSILTSCMLCLKIFS